MDLYINAYHLNNWLLSMYAFKYLYCSVTLLSQGWNYFFVFTQTLIYIKNIIETLDNSNIMRVILFKKNYTFLKKLLERLCHFLSQKHTFFPSDHLNQTLLTPKSFFAGVQNPILKKYSYVFMKSRRISSKSNTLQSLSPSGVDFEQFQNKFLDCSGLRILPSQKYSQLLVALSLFYKYNAA